MSQPWAFHNGHLVPAHTVALSPADGGLVFGATVTDFCRTYAGRLFRFRDHLARFRRDCATCFIPLGFDEATLVQQAEELVRRNHGLLPTETELALITFATPGPVVPYAEQAGPATLVMHTFPLSLARYAPLFRAGAHLSAVSAPYPGELAPVGAKHRSRLHWWRAAHLAPANTLALLTLPDGTVTETAIGNVLLVRDTLLLTAPTAVVLDGISQRITCALAERVGLSWQARPFTLADCLDADEVLLTGSAFGVAPVSQIGTSCRSWGGAVFRRLLSAWNAEVGLDLEQQFLRAGVVGEADG